MAETKVINSTGGQRINRLKDKQVRDARPKEGGKPNLLNDGNNLYLRVTQGSGGVVHKVWLFRSCGKWTGGIGPYPDVSLAEARDKAQELRGKVRGGVKDLAADRRRQKLAGPTPGSEKTFDQVAEEYHRTHCAKWSSVKFAKGWKAEMATYASPQRVGVGRCEFGKLRIGEVNTALIKEALDPNWRRRPGVLKRVRARIEAVIGFAMASEYIPMGPNPAGWATLKHLLPTVKRKIRHQPALPYKEVPWFMAELRGARAGELCALPLQFLILTAARNNEVRSAKWCQIDWQGRRWNVPEDTMKMRRPHVVPLSGAAMAILETRRGDRSLEEIADLYIFPGQWGDHAPIARDGMLTLTQSIKPGIRKSEGTVEQVASAHGFRSTFADWVGEEVEGVSEEVAEHALAHAAGDATRLAYRRARSVKKRVPLMAAWADFCAGKTAEPPTNVVPIRAVA
jgi:integrase